MDKMQGAMIEQRAPMSFAGRMQSFFGRKPDQTLSEFGAELKGLSLADKVELHSEFTRLGLPTREPGA